MARVKIVSRFSSIITGWHLGAKLFICDAGTTITRHKLEKLTKTGVRTR